jgi:hypothetical protein
MEHHFSLGLERLDSQRKVLDGSRERCGVKQKPPRGRRGHILMSGATWKILVGASHKNKIAKIRTDTDRGALRTESSAGARDGRRDSRPQRRGHPMAALFRLLFTRSVISID